MKTGSSAIQMFLNRNSAVLRREGIIVPDENMTLSTPVTGDQVFFFDRLRLGITDRAEQEIADRLGDLFGLEGTRQVVVSAENLADPDGLCASWFKGAAALYDTEVVIYLRRQDDLLVAAWQQWYAKVTEDIWDDWWSWLVTCVGKFGDWRTVLLGWESVVGRERMRVRIYEPAHLIDGDAVEDFQQFLLIRHGVELVSLDGPINASFREAIVDLVPGGALFRDSHDERFYEFVEAVLGDAAHRRRGESPITYRQRLAILSRYAESNRWVRTKYFDGFDVPDELFGAPRPEDYGRLSREELTHQQLQVLARLVFELAQMQVHRDIAEPGGGCADEAGQEF